MRVCGARSTSVHYLGGKRLSLERDSTTLLHSGVRLLGTQPSPVFRVPLPKSVFAPAAEIRLRKSGEEVSFLLSSGKTLMCPVGKFWLKSQMMCEGASKGVFNGMRWNLPGQRSANSERRMIHIFQPHARQAQRVDFDAIREGHPERDFAFPDFITDDECRVWFLKKPHSELPKGLWLRLVQIGHSHNFVCRWA
jgi:hypothetical protein